MTTEASTESPPAIIGLAGSFTTQPIGDALVELGHDVLHADYNQIFTTCLDPASAFGRPVTHLVVLWRLEDVFEADMRAYLSADVGAYERLVDHASELAALVCAVPGNEGLTVTLGLPPFPAGLGIDPLDSATTAPVADLLAHVRRVVGAAAANEPGVRILDHGRLIDSLGSTAHDHRNQLLYRQPYRTRATQLLATETHRLITALSMPPPKVIVLDADNTLWGGIVGEDGVSGIAIGDTFPGSAFREFQQALKQVERRGIMLAVASKNEPDAVAEVFAARSEMVLQTDDIASWRVNWMNKSTNITEIAAELNIGLDSMVFFDDSDFEVEEVRTALPMVRVFKVPEDPEDIPALLADTGLFRNLQATDEDRGRTEMMLTERKRDVAASSAMSHEEFLDSLDLSVVFETDNEESLGRVTQLINKTNQFNLTTIRRSEAEVLELMRSPQHRVHSVSVTDRFGSYGLVGVAIVDASDATTHEVDSLLMSCRVLRRGIESTIITRVCDDAEMEKAASVVGRFVPTSKNAQVENLYVEHGFDALDDSGRFTLRLPHSLKSPSHIDVTHA